MTRESGTAGTSRIAVSNIGLPAFDHVGLLAPLAALGVGGIEVAPSRVWRDTWEGLSAAAVEGYRRDVEAAGLRVVGLHSLFFDHPDLGLFKGGDSLVRTIEFMAHLSALCRDLGGRTLIYGGGRRRGDVPFDRAKAECVEFLDRLLPRMAAHGTMLCFEPLGPRDTDFLNSAAECLALVEEIGHPALGLQLDAKALVENGETDEATFASVRGRLAHYHANDPGLVVVGSTGAVDHHGLAAGLDGIDYAGWVSIEQRLVNPADPLGDLTASVATVASIYGAAA